MLRCGLSRLDYRWSTTPPIRWCAVPPEYLVGHGRRPAGLLLRHPEIPVGRDERTDVFAFLEAQRNPRADGRVVELEDRERGLAVRTIKRWGWLASGAVRLPPRTWGRWGRLSPVPAGLGDAASWGSGAGQRGEPLLRTPRTLPRVLAPETANHFLAALALTATSDGRGHALRWTPPLRGSGIALAGRLSRRAPRLYFRR